MLLRQIFDSSLAQYAYLIGCQQTGEAIIVDPERDISQYKQLADENSLRITAVAETHIHADFVSGAQEFVGDDSVRIYLSKEGGSDWQYAWPKPDHKVRLIGHLDTIHVGKIEITAISTPGHTPEHLSYLVLDLGAGADQPMALLTGDFVFVGDVGRPDLLETAAGVQGTMRDSAEALRKSLVERLDDLPDFLQILPGHGAGSACGKSLGAVPTTTLGYERLFNNSLRTAGEDKDKFIEEILTGQPDPPLYFARMKKVNRDGTRVTGGFSQPTRLEPDAFDKRACEENTYVLDLHNDAEAFSDGHFAKAILAPLHTSFFLSSAGSYVSEHDKILLCTETDEDAVTAVQQLYRIGLDCVEGYALFSELKKASKLSATLPRQDFDSWNYSSLEEGSQILDVRTSSEFEEGHLAGAISIPYTRLKDRMSELSRDIHYFVHCGSGRRAALASSFLAGHRYKTTYVDGICHECRDIAKRLNITNQ